MTLEDVADELYRLPLPEFTSRRDARAAAAARDGDRALSAAIKGLRKPTTGAWLANLLAHDRADDVAELVALGAALRSAQGRLAGDDLRRLSQRRHELVTALAAEAARLARNAGNRAGEPAIAEVQETLEAALSDEDAARALQSGRLTTRLQHTGSGFGEVTAVEPSPRPPKGKTGQGAVTAAAEARRRRSAQRVLRERAEREVDRLTTRVDRLEEELRSARAVAEEARQALRAARADEQDAEKSVTRAEAEVRRLEG